MAKKMHYLVLSEKPSLSRTVEAVYKKHADEYPFTADFMSFAGHLCALKEPGEYKQEWNKWDLNVLPMIPDNFEYVIGKGKNKLFNEIKKEIKNHKYDAIVNNCDGDAEGQAIFHTNMLLMKPNLPFLRLWPHDLTENEIDRAFKNLRDEKEESLINLTNRAMLRAQLDWLIGMNGSRAFALTTKSKTVIGRVQTPTLKLIVDRELEIKNFKPQEYYNLNATFKHDKDTYIGTYFKENDNSLIFDKKELESIKNNLKNDAIIKNIEKKKVTTYAPALFSLTTLQQEANNKLGFSAQKTLDLAQSLYEAKLISYPRTESICVTEAISKTFESLLNNLEGSITKFTKQITKQMIKETSDNKKYVNDKKVGSHYALIPTSEKLSKHSLTKDEQNLYNLIVERFVAIFLPASVSEKTTIITENNNFLFKTNGSIMIEKGYLELLGYDGGDTILPNIKEKEQVKMIDSKIISKMTTPPARYNDATLIKAMETAGKHLDDDELKEEMKGLSLGTPATRAGIIERLLKLKVVEKQKKYFVPTNLGIWQIQELGTQDVANVDLTAKYEQKLAQIENGTLSTTKFKTDMIKYIKDLTNELKKLNKINNMGGNNLMNSNENIKGKCPICGEEILENDKVFACSNKDNCNFRIFKNILKAEITVDDLNKLIMGESTEPKTMISNKGSKFTAKLKLKPNLTELEFIFDNISNSSNTKDIGTCPVCGETVVSTTGKFGKYYKCTSCDFKISGTIAGKSLTDAQIKQLLVNKETKEIKGFKSNKGTEFDAKLRLDENNKVTFATNKD